MLFGDVLQGVGTQTQTSSGDGVPHLGFAALGPQSCTTGRELPDGPIYGHLVQTIPFAVKVANTIKHTRFESTLSSEQVEFA